MDVSFYLGETWTIDFTFNDAEDAPIDLTGSTVEFRISTVAQSPLLTLGLGAGVTVTDAAAGKCTVNVSPEEQAPFLAPKVYLFEARVTAAEGGVSVQAAGMLKTRQSLFNVSS